MSNEINLDIRKSDRKSYWGFLKEVVQLRGVPQLLIIFAIISFGTGTVNIAPAVVTDSFARNYYDYNGPSCSSYGTDIALPSECNSATLYAQSAASISSLIASVLTFIMSPVLGSLSDRIGRKYLFLLGVLLFTIGQVVLLVILIFPTFDPMSYYIMNALKGFAGYFFPSFTIMADVTEPGIRAVAFSLILICGASTISLVQQIALAIGNSNAVAIAVLVSTLGLIYGLLYLPETLSPENKAIAVREREEEEANGITILSTVLRPLRDLKIMNRNLFFRLVALVVFFSLTVKAGERVLFLFYVENQLGFNETNVATYVLLHSFGGVLAQSLILNALVQRTGERNVVIIAMLCGGLSSFLYGVARNSTLIYIGSIIFAISGIDNATISSMLSFNVEEHEQGIIQGVNAAVQAFASSIGPVFLNYVFDITENGAFLGPSTFFFVATLFYTIAVAFAYAFPVEAANSKRFRENGEGMSKGLLSEHGVLPIVGRRS